MLILLLVACTIGYVVLRRRASGSRTVAPILYGASTAEGTTSAVFERRGSYIYSFPNATTYTAYPTVGPAPEKRMQRCVCVVNSEQDITTGSVTPAHPRVNSNHQRTDALGPMVQLANATNTAPTSSQQGQQSTMVELRIDVKCCLVACLIERVTGLTVGGDNRCSRNEQRTDNSASEALANS